MLEGELFNKYKLSHVTYTKCQMVQGICGANPLSSLHSAGSELQPSTTAMAATAIAQSASPVCSVRRSVETRRATSLPGAAMGPQGYHRLPWAC